MGKETHLPNSLLKMGYVTSRGRAFVSVFMSFMDSYSEILFIHVVVGFILASLRLYCLPRNAERFMEIKVLLKGFVFFS